MELPLWVANAGADCTCACATAGTTPIGRAVMLTSKPTGGSYPHTDPQATGLGCHSCRRRLACPSKRHHTVPAKLCWSVSHPCMLPKVFQLNISCFTHKAETYVDVDIFSIFARLMIVLHFY